MATEKRLIDANALDEHIKDLPTWWADDGGFYGGAMKYPEGMFIPEDIISSIENAPTVDAVEVVHGRWVNVGGDLHYSGVLYNCSVCNKVHFVNARHALVTLHYHDEIFNKPQYCPNCGAKMDGERRG